MSFISSIVPKTGIKVAFIDNDGKKVSGITVDQANQVAKKYPDKKFYFQNGDGVEQELDIKQVNELLPTDLLPTAPSCPTEPQVCSSPLVRFFGGGGTGASANPIISPISSSVISFDIINSGFGFFRSPSAELIDPCGKGSGAKLRVNMEDDDEDTGKEGDGTSLEDETNLDIVIDSTSSSNGNVVGIATTNIGGIVVGIATTNIGGGGIGIATISINTGTKTDAGTGTNIVQTNFCKSPQILFEKSVNKFRNRSQKIKNISILSPGDGYLFAPDGSLGANERVWKEPDEGYVKTKCGGYYVVQPYKPIRVSKGDTYYPPNGLPRVLNEDEIINLPLVPVVPPRPENIGQTYSVLLFIEEIEVLDPGFGYRQGDQLIITPDNGATADLNINDRGEVESVTVTNPGIGFLDLPSLRTNSLTGFNATFSTILKPIKIDITKSIEEQLKNIKPFNQLNALGKLIPIIPNQIELISVIDCVGRIF